MNIVIREALQFVFKLGCILLAIAILVLVMFVDKVDSQSTPIALSLAESFGFSGAIQICVSSILLGIFPLKSK